MNFATPSLEPRTLNIEVGKLAQMEVKISSDMPLPTPRSVMSSPSHMTRPVPAVIATMVAASAISATLATFLIGPLSDLAWSWKACPTAPSFSIDAWLQDGTTLPKGILLQSRRRFGELSDALTNALVTLLTDRMVDAAFPEADAKTRNVFRFLCRNRAGP